MPILRPGRAGHPRAARRLRRPPLRLAPPAAERRPSEGPARRGGTEAAAAQGSFWEMHDLLLQHQDALRVAISSDTPRSSGSTPRSSTSELRKPRGPGACRGRRSADQSGVSGTPTFFINGRRHYGAYDIETLRTRCGPRRPRRPSPTSCPEPGLRRPLPSRVRASGAPSRAPRPRRAAGTRGRRTSRRAGRSPRRHRRSSARCDH